MTTSTATSIYWTDWVVADSGDGTVVLTNDDQAMVANSSAGSLAYMFKRMPATPGEKITFSCLASSDSGQMQMSINYPTAATQASVVVMDSQGLRKYTIEYVIPYTTDITFSYVQLNIGGLGDAVVNGKIIAPQIISENSANGFLRTFAMGLIRMQKVGGIVECSINQSYAFAGIKAVAYDAGTKKLNITTGQLPPVGFGIRPVFDAGLTFDALESLNAKIGDYDGVTGGVSVKFTDNTGAVDITPLLAEGEIAYCWVKATGL